MLYISITVYTCAREAAYLRQRIMSGEGMLSESFKGRGFRGKRRRGVAGGRDLTQTIAVRTDRGAYTWQRGTTYR